MLLLYHLSNFLRNQTALQLTLCYQMMVDIGKGLDRDRRNNLKQNELLVLFRISITTARVRRQKSEVREPVTESGRCLPLRPADWMILIGRFVAGLAVGHFRGAPCWYSQMVHPDPPPVDPSAVNQDSYSS